MPQPGSHIGSYEVVGHLGSGGMGAATYLAFTAPVLFGIGVDGMAAEWCTILLTLSLFLSYLLLGSRFSLSKR